VLLYSPWLSTGRRLIGTSGGQCGQLKHQYKAGDDRMEKLLLTVWEAADVLSVSRSRVYELLYAGIIAPSADADRAVRYLAK
jgi:hypothetical protein